MVLLFLFSYRLLILTWSNPCFIPDTSFQINTWVFRSYLRGPWLQLVNRWCLTKSTDKIKQTVKNTWSIQSLQTKHSKVFCVLAFSIKYELRNKKSNECEKERVREGWGRGPTWRLPTCLRMCARLEGLYAMLANTSLSS